MCSASPRSHRRRSAASIPKASARLGKIHKIPHTRRRHRALHDLIKEAVNWAACYLKRLGKTAASGRVSISCPSLSNELPEKACHNRNSSYACDTVVFGNERLTLLVLTFGGCSDERHFKRFPVLIRTFGGCYEPHFKLFFDRRAGLMSARPQQQIFAK